MLLEIFPFTEHFTQDETKDGSHPGRLPLLATESSAHCQYKGNDRASPSSMAWITSTGRPCRFARITSCWHQTRDAYASV